MEMVCESKVKEMLLIAYNIYWKEAYYKEVY